MKSKRDNLGVDINKLFFKFKVLNQKLHLYNYNHIMKLYYMYITTNIFYKKEERN